MHKEGVVSCYCACAVHSLGSDEVPRVKDYFVDLFHHNAGQDNR